jgi:DNA-binding MarR family transcriptional regulator
LRAEPTLLRRDRTPGIVSANPARAHQSALAPVAQRPAHGRSDVMATRLGWKYPVVASPELVTISTKYVNMADINFPTIADAPSAVPSERPRAGEPVWDIIELFFFAYRDFVGEPDHLLEKFSFGRAHHRVLHFVNRSPGMKVAELLDILKITKQSLGRVLKQLIDQGYVVQKAGPNDRRQRLLYVTPKGEALAMRLAGLQSGRVARALAELGPDAHAAATRFLIAMIDAENRDGVLRFVARANRARRQKT